MTQTSKVCSHWAHTTHLNLSPIDAQAICVEAEQDAWMLLDIIEMEREDREREPIIDDSPKDWAVFELD